MFFLFLQELITPRGELWEVIPSIFDQISITPVLVFAIADFLLNKLLLFPILFNKHFELLANIDPFILFKESESHFNKSFYIDILQFLDQRQRCYEIILHYYFSPFLKDCNANGKNEEKSTVSVEWEYEIPQSDGFMELKFLG